MFKVINCGRYIPLTQGQKTLVDVGDFYELARHKWYAQPMKNGTFYPRRVTSLADGEKMITMSRWILGAKDGELADHVNRNPLDNRRCNLRIATREQNARNSKKARPSQSGFIGVRKSKNKWMAKVGFEGGEIFVGMFNTPEEAALARDHKARELHGEFAVLNFPEET